MLKHTFFTGLFLLNAIFALGQCSSKFGLVLGPGIANDINNLGLKFEPAFAMKAGVFVIHPLNQKFLISGESGYLKTGFKDHIYYSFPAGTSMGRKEYYSVRYHKLYATIGLKIPLSKNKERYYIQPGFSVHYLLNHEFVNGESNATHHYKSFIEDYRSIQVHADVETGILIDNFSVAVVFSPQVINNASDKGKLKAYSYYTGICLRLPLGYFK